MIESIIKQLGEAFYSGLHLPLAIIIFGMGPLFIAGWFLHRKKALYKAQSKEPFTRLPLRPAGESLRLKIDELSDRFDESLLSLALSNVFAVVLIATAEPSKRLIVGCALGVLVVIAYFRYFPRLSRTARQLWDCRLGYKGERLVGEELNQLLSSGFRVFHDVPFDNFNIDHVLVGPPGVYVVETKTRRKPSAIEGRSKAVIVFDGDQLHFPMGSDSKSIEQARRNAKTISTWLTSAVGEAVLVNAILTIPGWWIDRTARGDVNVLNPEEIKYSFPRSPKEPLEEKRIQQIAHQLAERCRLKMTESDT